MAKYPVKRGSRYDRLSIAIIRSWVIEGMNIAEGLEVNFDATEDKKFLSRSPDFIMGHVEEETIDMYSRIVVYSKSNGEGKRATLTNMDGDEFTIPDQTATREDLTTGYYNWLKMGEIEQEEIDKEIIEMNKSLAPRHILPVEQLTESEKTDPNS